MKRKSPTELTKPTNKKIKDIWSIIEKDDAESLELFLSSGIDINSFIKEDMLPIHYIGVKNAVNCLNFLIENNYEINKGNIINSTILHYAAESGSFETMQILLNNNDLGFNLRNVNDNGYNALHYAAATGNKQIFDLNLSAAIQNLDDVNCDGERALDIAVKEGYFEFIEELIKAGANKEFLSQEAEQTIKTMIDEDQLDILKFLINKEFIKPNYCDSEGNYLIHLAAASGNLKILNYITTLGEDINIADAEGNSAMHVGVIKGDLMVVKYLIDVALACTSPSNIKGLTPLHYAAAYGNNDILNLLIENKAPLNAESLDKKTPLHLAAVYGHNDIIKSLLNHNADKEALDNNNCSPLDLSINHTIIVSAQYLIEKGAKLNSIYEDGNTLLHLAAIEGWLNILKATLNRGIDINAVNDEGNTALHLAIINGHNEIIKHLVLQGVDISIQNYNGYDALALAVKQQDINLTLFFIKEGAEVKSNIDGVITSEFHEIFQLTHFIKDFCSAFPQYKLNDDLKKMMENESLSTLAKDIIIKHLINTGFDQSNLLAFKKNISIFSPELQKNILKDIEALDKVASSSLELLEAHLISDTLALPFMIYEQIELWSMRANKKDKLIHLNNFYNQNPEFKELGNYLKHIKDNKDLNIESLNVPLINSLMLADEGVVELVKILNNKVILPLSLKVIIRDSLEFHKILVKKPEIVTIAKQNKDLRSQNKSIIENNDKNDKLEEGVDFLKEQNKKQEEKIATLEAILENEVNLLKEQQEEKIALLNSAWESEVNLLKEQEEKTSSELRLLKEQAAKQEEKTSYLEVLLKSILHSMPNIVINPPIFSAEEDNSVEIAGDTSINPDDNT